MRSYQVTYFEFSNYSISNGLGNVRAVISDRKFIKAKSIFIAELVTAIDYYAFGDPLYGRKYVSQAGSYCYGFNGKDNESETFEGDLDLGASIYGNSPISQLNYDGMGGDDPLKFTKSLSLTINLDTKKQNSINLGLSVGTSIMLSNHSMYGANLSVNLYNGGLGTRQGVTGKTELQVDFVLSLSVTGSKSGTLTNPMPLYKFQSNAQKKFQNPIKNSTTYGINFILDSDGRNQINNSIGFRKGDIYFQTYNDVDFFRFMIPGDDRWCTGGGRIDYRMGNAVLSIGGDVFTDERMNCNRNANSGHISLGISQIYSNRDIKYNYGQSFVQFQSVLRIMRANYSGSNNIFWQNFIHIAMGYDKFKSVSKNVVQGSVTPILNR